MGLFSSKKAPEPVRRAQVMKLLQATMAESDADHDDDSPEWRRAHRNRGFMGSQSTKAEVRAAFDLARRNGYT